MPIGMKKSEKILYTRDNVFCFHYDSRVRLSQIIRLQLKIFENYQCSFSFAGVSIDV